MCKLWANTYFGIQTLCKLLRCANMCKPSANQHCANRVQTKNVIKWANHVQTKCKLYLDLWCKLCANLRISFDTNSVQTISKPYVNSVLWLLNFWGRWNFKATDTLRTLSSTFLTTKTIAGVHQISALANYVQTKCSCVHTKYCRVQTKYSHEQT